MSMHVGIFEPFLKMNIQIHSGSKKWTKIFYLLGIYYEPRVSVLDTGH